MTESMMINVYFDRLESTFVSWFGDLQAAVPSSKLSVIDAEPDGPGSTWCILELHYEASELPLVEKFFGA